VRLPVAVGTPGVFGALDVLGQLSLEGGLGVIPAVGGQTGIRLEAKSTVQTAVRDKSIVPKLFKS